LKDYCNKEADKASLLISKSSSMIKNKELMYELQMSVLFTKKNPCIINLKGVFSDFASLDPGLFSSDT